jgi:predicted DNA-binding transcriptional regulator YafY
VPDEPDTLLATFRLSDFVELKRWLKGFGEHAEALKPESLRRQMRDELLAAARRYQS